MVRVSIRYRVARPGCRVVTVNGNKSAQCTRSDLLCCHHHHRNAQGAIIRAQDSTMQLSKLCQFCSISSKVKPMNECPECKCKRIREVGTETICPECGLVLEDTPIQQGYIPESVKKHATTPCLSIAETRPIGGKIFKASWLLSTREKNIKIHDKSTSNN